MLHFDKAAFHPLSTFAILDNPPPPSGPRAALAAAFDADGEGWLAWTGTKWVPLAEGGSAQAAVFFRKIGGIGPEALLADCLTDAAEVTDECAEELGREDDADGIVATVGIVESNRDEPASGIIDETTDVDPVFARRNEKSAHADDPSTAAEDGQ